MSSYTIIYPATLDWYLLYQRPQQMLKAFARKGVRSIFVSAENYVRLPNAYVEISENLFVVKPTYNFTPLVQGKRVMWFSYPGHYRYGLGSFNVFDMVDNPTGEFAGWRTHLYPAVQAAHLISCTADVMYQQLKPYGKPIFMLPNGADYNHFSKASCSLPRPYDMPDFNGEKVIGFYGAMASWVDYELIRRIADKYKIVLIGKNQFFNHTLHHPNVVNLPHKDYHDLPSYLSHFDLAMVPFKLTEMIKGCDPIKFYEFLAAGKPVIATRMPELDKYRDVVYFIDHYNWDEPIQKAIEEDTPEKKSRRMQLAHENSWDERATKALEMINVYI